jgi:predicted PurR-regulated permease PerM
MTLSPSVISSVLVICAVPLVLCYHLLPVVFAGLAVHVLTVKLARLLPVSWGGLAHQLALAAIVICVMIGLLGAGLGLWSFLHGSGGMAALLATVAETLENVRRTAPSSVVDAIPATMEDLRGQITAMSREHAKGISAAGMAGFKTFAHILLGMVIGGLTALHHFDAPDLFPPLVSALHARVRTLADAFDKVVFAQVKIAALNTFLTGLYLLVILPLFDVHLPLRTVLIPLTFVVGLLPVVGNVISNTAIVLISLGVSAHVAMGSLGFLVAIHKLEYFTNARIVGGEVQACAWELLCAMVTMEAVFGVPGLVAAPVVYAWLKEELKASSMI